MRPAAQDARRAEGAKLVMPLRRLAAPQQAPRLVPRLLQLDEPDDAGLAGWVARVREALETCLVVDGDGRVAAMSAACGRLLDVDPVRSTGVRLLDLCVLVDFTEGAVPLDDPEQAAPPLRALRTGRHARGLVRLRDHAGGLSTYDVVGVPLAGGVGAVGFLSEV